MLRIFSAISLLIGLSLVAGCSTEKMQSIDTTIVSRGVDVPVTFVTPVVKTGVRYPLVIMAHGHGGSRQEGGGFELAAETMAQQGIASIRMDFPGCGDSTESFTENNLSNMLLDLQAAREYAVAQPGVDSERIGLLGYSMGGRLVVLLAAEDPGYKVMATWTPALSDGAERLVIEFGGADKYQALKQLAQETGVAEYTTRWGTQLRLGERWFTDLEETRPLQALQTFKGPLLVLYGDEDDVVPPEVSEAAIASAINSAEVVRHVVVGANHALGIYTNRPEIAAEVMQTTAAFFSERL